MDLVQATIADTEALPLDMQIQMVEGAIRDMAGQRYRDMLTNLINNGDKDSLGGIASKTEGITALRKHLANIRKKQEAMIREDTQRIIREGTEAKAAIQAAEAKIKEAQEERSAAQDMYDN